MNTLGQDLRYGLRMLHRSPGFTAVAVLTLALGIGANTAIFSVVHVLLFKPLPYPEPERLVALARVNPLASQPGRGEMQFWPYPVFDAVRAQSRSFVAVAAYSNRTWTVTIAEQPEREQGEIVTAGYFPMLGVTAAIGRTFLPEEDRTPDTHRVIVLGHDFWQRRFDGDRDVIGKTVYLNKLPFIVIGVLPAGFRGQSGIAEFWVPMMMAGKLMFDSALTEPGHQLFKVIARLWSGLTLPQAQSEVSALVDEIARSLPRSRLPGLGKEFTRLIPLKETKVDPAVKRAFLVLLVAVGCVMLIACTNTANLLLGRGASRQKEFAVRLALGAGRGRIIRQLLTESLLLAALGGGVGLLVALWGLDWMKTAKPWNSGGFWSPYAKTFDYFSITLDLSVLAFNFLLAFITGVAFGLMPAWQAAKLQVNEMLKDGGLGFVSRFRTLRRPSARGALVVAEIALSLVLLTGAGLMIKSFARLTAVKLGFEPEGAMTMQLGDSPRPDFYRSLLARVQALPGVETASLSYATPLEATSRFQIEVEGRARSEFENIPVGINVVTPDFFRTFRIAVVNGRGLSAEDRVGAPRVAVINRAMAERFWPGSGPLGKRINPRLRARYEGAETWIEIVGVVEDVKYGAIEEPAGPVLYLSALQPALTPDSLSIRMTTDPAALIAAVRREVRALDPSVPISRITALRERASQATSRYRFSALLMSLFAGLALLLAGVGIYGVMSYAVSQRTREMGIRIALGAQRSEIFRLVIAEGAVLTLAGLALGLAAARAATRVLTSQLYEVRATDPMTFAAVALLLAAVALLACYIPARRATKVDPMVALRYE